MTEDENGLRRQMAELGASLFSRGYATGGAGNISARLGDGRILLTPTNSCLGRLEPDNISLLDANGMHVSGAKPSKECTLHLLVYQARPDCGAVVHLHSTYLTALSCLEGLDADDAIRAFTPYYVMRVGKLPVIPYFKPADTRIGVEVAKRLGQGVAVLMANHGVTVIGSNLVEAINNAEELEETAKLWFLLRGHAVRYLSAGGIAELKGTSAVTAKPAPPAAV